MSDHLILIPAFDEAATIGDVVSRAKRYGPVLVVDDGSSDGTGALASQAGAEVIRQEIRAGKGAALLAGFVEARARGVERIVTLDGDGQHDPAQIPALLEAAVADPDAIVVGQRLDACGRGLDTAMPCARGHAIRVAGFFINWLTDAALPDTQSGFRVYPASLSPELEACRGGFVLESEILVLAARAGRPLRAVPIHAAPAAGRQSRFRPFHDGFAVARVVAAHSIRRVAMDVKAAAQALVRPFGAERRWLRHREAALAT